MARHCSVCGSTAHDRRYHEHRRNPETKAERRRAAKLGWRRRKR